MPEETEIETNELQEHVEEAHHHAASEGHSWTKYIALSTATLAAFAAVGALQSGALVNEAMLDQLKASDTWGEYQATRQKTHLYSIAANSMLDAGIVPGKATKGEGAKQPPDRVAEYLGQVEKESGKSEGLSKQAKKLETEGGHLMESHERFAYSVALLQVAIALGAVSALTRNKVVWMLSGITGAIGIVLFILGFLR